MIEGIAGGVLAIAGILLALSGSQLLGRPINWRIGLGLALSGAGLFMLITALPQYAVGFSVLATLVLAFAALMAIKRTTDVEAIRKKEAIIKDINEWATEVGACILKNGTPQKGENIEHQIEDSEAAKKYIYLRYSDMETLFTPLRMRSVYIREIAKTDPKLQEHVDSAIENLRLKLRLLHKYHENMDKIEHKDGVLKAALNVAKNEYELYDSTVNLIKQVGGIKSLL